MSGAAPQSIQQSAPPPPPPTSVVVVSRGRPDLLRLALLSLAQQDHPALEAVVVADAAGLAAIADLPFHHRLKRRAFDEANISAARNAGIAAAAGEVVAFLDDDAAAEPGWARLLSAPFADPAVGAAAGFVRGRDGLGLQWGAAVVDGTGAEAPLDVPRGEVTLMRAPPGGAVKTVGTCAAFRRGVLVAAGGFDPRFHYFLDETDLNLRLAALGVVTAMVPEAQVIHAFAANANRRADRAPTDLSEIGASVAVFLGKHCPGPERAGALARFRADQRLRALRHMVTGALEPRDLRRLLAGFDRGAAEGAGRVAGPAPVLDTVPPDFAPLREDPGPVRPVVLARRCWNARRSRREAADATGPGTVVTLHLLSPSLIPHRLRFVEPGYWERTGGLFWTVNDQENVTNFSSFDRRDELEVH